MPKITRLADFTFSVENSLDACSPGELTEVRILINPKRYKSKIEEGVIKLINNQEEREEITNLGSILNFSLGDRKTFNTHT